MSRTGQVIIITVYPLHNDHLRHGGLIVIISQGIVMERWGFPVRKGKIIALSTKLVEISGVLFPNYRKVGLLYNDLYVLLSKNGNDYRSREVIAFPHTNNDRLEALIVMV